MDIRPSRRVAGIGSYAFAEVDRLVTELRSKGVLPIDFGVGDPTAPTPEVVREACRAAVNERARSGYPSYVGSLEFREACGTFMRDRFGVDLDPDTAISATGGSKEAVFHLHEGFVNPGDIVLGPNPGYPPYARGTLFAEGEHVPYALSADRGFLPDLTAIPDDVARRARILWICYPNSPTGAVAPLEFLRRAANWCRERDILLASDEAYSEIYFTEEPPHSALECGAEGVLAIFSLSKRSAMTCYRVGWVAGDERAVAIFRKVKTNLDSGTPTFVQDAAVAALSDEEHVAAFRAEYREKRDLMAKAFVDLGLPDCTPEAALYLWQRVPDGMTSVEFAKALLAPEIGIVVTPGPWIAGEVNGVNPGEGFVRLALVPSLDDCRLAAEKIKGLLKR
jgi:LL-diaminopimelate aminotransferase